MNAYEEAAPLRESETLVRKNRFGLLILLLAMAVFAGFSVYFAYHSQSDLEADATTHFLMSRFAPREFHYYASVWGRPLCTLTYATVAWIGTPDEGRFAARLVSLVMALAVSALTYRISKRQKYPLPVIAGIAMLAQPIFFFHSFSELTEIPFTLFLALAFGAFQKRQFFLMALFVGILPLGRPEGFGFILMAETGLVGYRKMRWLPILFIPFLVWNFAGYKLSGGMPDGPAYLRWVFNREWYLWVFHNNPYSAVSPYGHGKIYWFVICLPALISPLLFPFSLIGVGMIFKSLRSKIFGSAILVDNAAKRMPALHPVHQNRQNRTVSHADC